MELEGGKRRSKRFMNKEGRWNKRIDEQPCDSSHSTAAVISGLSLPVCELPVHILCDIFSRLPLKSIFRCRCVCKAFLELLQDSYFIELHCARSSTLTTHLFFHDNWQNRAVLRFLTFNHDEVGISLCSSDDQSFNHDLSSKQHIACQISAQIGFHIQRLDFVGSCNGLLCLYIESLPKPFYAICNPICCEMMKLPSLVVSAPLCTYANQSGFGYCRKTKKYKVISFMYLTPIDPVTSAESKRMIAKIHTLGADSWRIIENAPRPKLKSFDPLLNGALHWITDSYKPCELVSSFNLATETFEFVPPPAHFSLQYVNKISWINIGVLKDCLCICYIYEDADFEVWLMREYGVKESWIRHVSIDTKFYIKLQVEDLQRPIKFLNNGDLWFISSSESLVSFSPTKKTFRELRAMGRRKREVTAHDFSFISLKDVVGAKCPKVRGMKLENVTSFS
ncbi:F-box protein At3g07870-like [Henckelia pumila]|uniref:F-box protein At3g07870-like n=1 Tax=Henckelia pumila TaxID=405737 RepID=UPI003C6DC625